MKLHVDIQQACTEPVPDEDDIRNWIAAALQGHRHEAEVAFGRPEIADVLGIVEQLEVNQAEDARL